MFGFGYYTPVLILQAFCLYHAYKNNNQQKWYWIILFFPLGGCLIYLYDNFYSRNKLKSFSEVAKNIVNSNRRIEQLEREVKFNDNVTNKINLADAYMTVDRYEEAVKLYESCLTGFRSDDPFVQMKLLSAYYQHKNYKKVIELGQKLSGYKDFKNSEQRIALAWAYYFENDHAKCLEVFKDCNRTFTNYKHRVEYSKALLQLNKPEEAEGVLASLLEEFELLKGYERSATRGLMREAKELTRQLEKING
ncbi:MAG: CDC27 family protein [Cytophagaceae bacterium]